MAVSSSQLFQSQHLLRACASVVVVCWCLVPKTYEPIKWYVHPMQFYDVIYYIHNMKWCDIIKTDHPFALAQRCVILWLCCPERRCSRCKRAWAAPRHTEKWTALCLKEFSPLGWLCILFLLSVFFWCQTWCVRKSHWVWIGFPRSAGLHVQLRRLNR